MKLQKKKFIALIISKTKTLFSLFALLFILILSELFYLNFYTTPQYEVIAKKQSFVASVGLPDLALTQERYLRHRSLSGVFEIYPIDGSLREYAVSTFLLNDTRQRELK